VVSMGEKYVSKGQWFVFFSRGSGSVVYVSETVIVCIFRTVVSKIHSSHPWEVVG